MRPNARKTAAHVLSADPPIFYVRPRPVPFGLAGLLAEQTRGQPMVCLARTMWTVELRDTLLETVLPYRAFTRAYPHIRVIVMANTEREFELLSANGVDTVLANHNMFVDETIFRPLPAIPRTFDAIYNANFNDFKRRELCAEIAACAHVGYFTDTETRDNWLGRFRQERKKLPHHAFLNPIVDGQVRRLEFRGVNRCLAQAHVGLCLSAVEGPMVACMEYLLAGLPVVTTPNLGGRDRYLAPDVSITADDNPRSIREAVEALVARNIPRRYVRQTTLKRLEADRAAFNAFIDGLRDGRPANFDDPRWRFHYTPNLFRYDSPEAFAGELGLPRSVVGADLNVQRLFDDTLTSERDFDVTMP